MHLCFSWPLTQGNRSSIETKRLCVLTERTVDHSKLLRVIIFTRSHLVYHHVMFRKSAYLARNFIASLDSLSLMQKFGGSPHAALPKWLRMKESSIIATSSGRDILRHRRKKIDCLVSCLQTKIYALGQTLIFI